MRKLLACTLLMFFAISMLVSVSSFGQEEENSYFYGEIIDMSENSITISRAVYDEETGEEATEEVTYSLTPDTALENVASLDALEVGQEVDIEYVEKDNGKEVTYIYVYVEEEE